MDTRKRYQTLLQATLPRHARHLILHTQVHSYLRSNKRRIKTHSEKPKARLYPLYKNYRMVMRLKYWHISQEVNSLMQVYYSRKPRNPE